jgi:hypothetical protein
MYLFAFDFFVATLSLNPKGFLCNFNYKTEQNCLQTIPIYVFGQSYGGKMGSHFTLHLYNVRYINSTSYELLSFWVRKKLEIRSVVQGRPTVQCYDCQKRFFCKHNAVVKHSTVIVTDFKSSF